MEISEELLGENFEGFFVREFLRRNLKNGIYEEFWDEEWNL